MKLKTLVLLFVIISISNIKAQELKPVLNFSTTQKIMNGCIEYAETNKLNLAIAIYDIHGQLLNFVRMDGASVGTAKVALWKGLSASLYQYSTEETGKWNAPTAPEIATIPGGIPIKLKNGQIIGSVGVAGATSIVDVKCAEFGLQKTGL